MAAALSELRQEKAATQEDKAPAPAHAESAPVDQSAAAPSDAEQKPKDSQASATTAAAQKPAAEDDAEALRKTREELHRVQSELGRVGALNRHLTETRNQLEQLRRENEQLKQSPRAGEVAESAEATADKLAELSERVKDFPELQGLVSAVAESLKKVEDTAAAAAKQAAAQVVQPLEGLRAEVEQRHQQERDAAYQAALTTFHETYPTAVDAIKSQDFQAWIPMAPKQVQDAFRNGSTPDEAMAVMDAFDAHLRRSGKPSIAQYQQTSQQPAAAATPVPAPQKSTSNAARLQSAAGLPSRASGAKGGLPPEDDFEGSLEFFRRQRLRAAQAA